MEQLSTQSSCQSCQKQAKLLKTRPKQSQKLPLIISVLLAILPKCPFCVLAYSSAITLCSGTKLSFYQPDWTAYLSIALAVLTVLFLLLNYKGKKTLIAISTAIIGCCFILESALLSGDTIIYYTGVFILFFGIWVNGSFVYFYNKEW